MIANFREGPKVTVHVMTKLAENMRDNYKVAGTFVVIKTHQVTKVLGIKQNVCPSCHQTYIQEDTEQVQERHREATKQLERNLHRTTGYRNKI